MSIHWGACLPKLARLSPFKIRLHFPCFYAQVLFLLPCYRDSSRADFGSKFVYTHVIKVSLFHGVSLSSTGAAKGAILWYKFWWHGYSFWLCNVLISTLLARVFSLSSSYFSACRGESPRCFDSGLWYHIVKRHERNPSRRLIQLLSKLPVIACWLMVIRVIELRDCDTLRSRTGNMQTISSLDSQ